MKHLVEVFRAVWRVLRKDGLLFLNLGDSYWGGKGRSSQAWSTSHTDRGVIQGPQHQIAGMGETRPQDGKHPILKPKDLVGIPWRVALALQEDGWYLRNDCIWAKGVSFCPTYNGSVLPESVTDRFTRAHEYVFMFSKSEKYFFDMEAVREPGANGSASTATFRRKNSKRNQLIPHQDAATHRPNREDSDFTGYRQPRDVWAFSAKGSRDEHFATFPERLPEIAILAGTSEYGCCSTCGKPWVRVVERQVTGELKDKPYCRDGQMKAYGLVATNGLYHSSLGGQQGKVVRSTIDWKPGCACSEQIAEPCVVLDPFLGSGTTLLVARKLGRSGIGIELNPDYAALSKDRIESFEPLVSGQVELVKI